MMARQDQDENRGSSALVTPPSEGAGIMQATNRYHTSQQNLFQGYAADIQNASNQDSVGFVTTDSTLQMAMGILSRALGLEGESALTLDQLQHLASETRAKKISPRYQLIHRVSHSRGIRMYLDEPQWIAGEISDKDALAGNLPIHNVPEYLSKHPEICFVIWRDYKLRQSKDEAKKDYWHKEDRRSQGLKAECAEIPIHEGETVEPTTEIASWAIDRFREHFGFDFNISDGFKFNNTDATSSNALEAPYFELYHTRGDNLKVFFETLETEIQHQFQVLLDYVYSQYADEYQVVDDMIGRGKILTSHVRYLFKPGDIVVQGHGDEVQGFLTQNWLQKGHKVAKAGTETRSFNLDCQYWVFDGMFSRNKKTLKLECDLADTSEKKIDDLHIRPLKYVQEATVMRLKQRGQRIWRCRVRSMVSYGEIHSTASQGSHDGR